MQAGRTRLQNTKITMTFFSKNTDLPSTFFQNSYTETFFYIPSICMYLQTTRAKFFQDLTIDKICFL